MHQPKCEKNINTLAVIEPNEWSGEGERKREREREREREGDSIK